MKVGGAESPGNEVAFFPGLSPYFDAGDKNVSLFIMEMYTNFAKTGDPTTQPISGVTWEKYNSTHRAYLRVDTHSKMAAAFAPRRMAFWKDYYPKLAQVQFAIKDKVCSGASPDITMAVFLKVACFRCYICFQCVFLKAKGDGIKTLSYLIYLELRLIIITVAVFVIF